MSEMVETIVKIAIGIVQLIIGLGLAVGAIYIGVRLLSKLTGGLDLETEIKKGNAAVAWLMLGVVIAIANVIASGIAGLTTNLTTIEKGAGVKDYMMPVGGGLLQVVVGLIFAVLAITIAFKVWDKITTKVEEVDELKKGNVAIGIVMAGVVVAVSIVIQAGVSGLASAFA